LQRIDGVAGLLYDCASWRVYQLVCLEHVYNLQSYHSAWKSHIYNAAAAGTEEEEEEEEEEEDD
jgi:hypothetical protein